MRITPLAGIARAPRALAAALAGALLATATNAGAHDMWISPDRSALRRGEHMRARLVVGEALAVEQTKPYAADRTPSFVLHDRRGAVNLRVPEGADPLLAAQRLRGTGEHLLAMQRDWTTIALPAERFAQYLEHEGVATLLAGQPLVGEQRERYRRSLKSLVRVGRGRGGELHRTPLGHSLEVVLLDAPARLRRGDRLRARLLRDGHPLAAHPLTAHVRDARGVVSSHRVVTNADGIAVFPVAGPGNWLVRTVHVARCGGCDDVDWQSDWTAFSFAVG